ncbi:NUDIX domain-containing protein [Bradyrhizobium guangdongense]
MREIAAAVLLDQCERLLVQLRDDIPGVLQPGKIGLFGGHRERDESLLDCAVREVGEEISYHIPADRFEPLMTFDGSDPEIKGGRVKGEFFVVRNVPVDRLRITEGKLLILRPEEILMLRGRLTPIASLVLDRFMQ